VKESSSEHSSVRTSTSMTQHSRMSTGRCAQGSSTRKMLDALNESSWMFLISSCASLSPTYSLTTSLSRPYSGPNFPVLLHSPLYPPEPFSASGRTPTRLHTLTTPHFHPIPCRRHRQSQLWTWMPAFAHRQKARHTQTKRKTWKPACLAYYLHNPRRSRKEIQSPCRDFLQHSTFFETSPCPAFMPRPKPLDSRLHFVVAFSIVLQFASPVISRRYLFVNVLIGSVSMISHLMNKQRLCTLLMNMLLYL